MKSQMSWRSPRTRRRTIEQVILKVYLPRDAACHFASRKVVLTREVRKHDTPLFQNLIVAFDRLVNTSPDKSIGGWTSNAPLNFMSSEPSVLAKKITGHVSCMHIYALWHMTFGLFKHVVSYCIRRPFVDQITLEEGPLLSIRLLW